MSIPVNFEHLPASMRQLAAAGVTPHCPHRTRFITEGDAGTSVYVLLSGPVKAFASDLVGRRSSRHCWPWRR